MSNVQKRDSFGITLARCLRYGVASVKVPVRLALIGGVSFGVAAGIATFAAGTFFTNLIQQARDVYTVYRLIGERDELRASNERLEKEVAALEHEYARKAEFQRDVREKLVSLEQALKSSAALSLFGRHPETSSAKGAASKGKGGSVQKEPPSLAAILNSPQLAAKGSAKKKDSESEECGKDEDECPAGARKEHISLHGDSAQDLAVHAVMAQDEQQDVEQAVERALMESLDTLLYTMERMPIGTPALGRYSSGFGYRVSPFSSHSSFHEGIDVSLPRGGKVVATGAGVVRKVGYHHHYGLIVDIAHTPDLVTRYAHLSKATVREGQAVDRGQKIGLSGASGRATGPHVHYEILHKGRAKNPKPYVTLADTLPDSL